jgi:hypothetical protein
VLESPESPQPLPLSNSTATATREIERRKLNDITVTTPPPRAYNDADMESPLLVYSPRRM